MSGRSYVVEYRQTITVTNLVNAASKAEAIRKVQQFAPDVEQVAFDTVPGTRRSFVATADEGPKPGGSES